MLYKKKCFKKALFVFLHIALCAQASAQDTVVVPQPRVRITAPTCVYIASLNISSISVLTGETMATFDNAAVAGKKGV